MLEDSCSQEVRSGDPTTSSTSLLEMAPEASLDVVLHASALLSCPRGLAVDGALEDQQCRQSRPRPTPTTPDADCEQLVVEAGVSAKFLQPKLPEAFASPTIDADCESLEAEAEAEVSSNCLQLEVEEADASPLTVPVSAYCLLRDVRPAVASTSVTCLLVDAVEVEADASSLTVSANRLPLDVVLVSPSVSANYLGLDRAAACANCLPLV